MTAAVALPAFVAVPAVLFVLAGLGLAIALLGVVGMLLHRPPEPVARDRRLRVMV